MYTDKQHDLQPSPRHYKDYIMSGECSRNITVGDVKVRHHLGKPDVCERIKLKGC